MVVLSHMNVVKVVCYTALMLVGISVASLFHVVPRVGTERRAGASSRKLLQQWTQTSLLQQWAQEIGTSDNSSDNSSDSSIPTLDEFMKKANETKRKTLRSPPPPPPHPARYEMCQGIPYKRYKFVKSFAEIREALSSAKPGDLIEVKSGVYFQGSGPGSSSLIPPDLSVDERGNATANVNDPRQKKTFVKYIRSMDLNKTEEDHLADMYSDLDLLYAYSDADLLELAGEKDKEAQPPAPAPAPKQKRPGRPPKGSVAKPPNNEPISSVSTKPPHAGKPSKEDSKKPSNTDATVADEDAPARPPKNDEKPASASFGGKPHSDINLPEIDTEDRDDYEVAPAPGPPKPINKPTGPRPGPWVAPSGFIDNLHGTEEAPITLCGPKTAVFDGSNGNGGLAAAALRVIRSSNVVVKGFTLQNALKGLDVQMTNSSVFSNITTRYTLQEGIRLRYNSTFNTVHGCNISYTGRLWVGIGEGMYVGTSTRNSIAAGLPEDHSNFNNITSNYFGEGITAENIDLKEFTSGGLISNNTFNGSSIAGLNGAIAWVAIKGNNYTVVNNTGSGTLKGGQGYRVLQIHDGLAEENIVMNNACHNFTKGSFCVFIDPRAVRTRVDCDNKRTNDDSGTYIKAFAPTPRVCNCDIDTSCSQESQATVFIRSASHGAGGASEHIHEFYTTGYPVENQFMGDSDEFRPIWD